MGLWISHTVKGSGGWLAVLGNGLVSPVSMDYWRRVRVLIYNHERASMLLAAAKSAHR